MGCQVQSELHNYLSEKEENDIKNMPDTLCHYTSIDNLLHILSSRSLWLNPFQNLNDHMEIEIGKSLIEKSLLEVFDTRELRFQAARNIEIFKDIFENNSYFSAIFSFSEDPENSRMWNYFADRFRGGVIGFNKEIFFREKDPADIYLLKVIYDEREASRIFHDIVQIYMTESLACPCRHEFRHRDHSIALLTYLLTILPSIKHHYYEDEQEYRLCFASIITPGERPVWHPELSRNNVEFREHDRDYRVICWINPEIDLSEIWLPKDKEYDTNIQKIIKILTNFSNFKPYYYGQEIDRYRPQLLNF